MTKKTAGNSKFVEVLGCYLFTLNDDVNTKAKLLLLGCSEEDILLSSVSSKNHVIDSENMFVDDRTAIMSMSCNFYNLVSELNKQVFFIVPKQDIHFIIDQPKEDCFVLLSKKIFLDNVTDQYIDDENNNINLTIYYAYCKE